MTGRVFRTLNIIDEFTREALVIRVKRRLNSTDVVDALTDLFILRGSPEFIRSDNGAEFIAQEGACLDWGCRRQNRVHRPRITMGKTATVRVSIPASATSCLTARYSIRYAKLRS